MTLQEARKVAEMCSMLNAECPYSIPTILENLRIYFPEFRWFANPAGGIVVGDKSNDYHD